jgi:spermidine synthase
VTPPFAPRRALIPLLALFFFSGAASLLYEVLWMRRLTLVFGATQPAVATILAAFMLGLAIGAALGGRVADRRSDLLRIYGFLELGIAAYALVFPTLVAGCTIVYQALFEAESVQYWSSQALHGVLMGGLVLLPTIAMGATLPLVVRWATDRLSSVGARGGVLYGFNTAGAVFGVWAAGFVLLPWLGVRGSELVGVGANVLVGIIALVWSARTTTQAVEDDREERQEEYGLLDIEEDPDLAGDRGIRLAGLVPWVLGVSGACSMIFEVAWTRFLALILGSSVYAFTLMLTAFLLGHAAGALVSSAMLRSPKSRPLRTMNLALFGAGISAFGTNHLFQFLPYWYVDAYALIGGHDAGLWFVHGAIAVLVMTPTTFFIGMLFPIGLRLVSRTSQGVARDVARVYSANTFGAVVGSPLAGFLLIPVIGIQDAIRLAVLLQLSAAAVVSWQRVSLPARRFGTAAAAGLAGLVLLAAPPWDPLLMSAGMYKYVSDLSDTSHEAVRNFAVSDYDLLFYEEGRTSVVTVARSVGTENIWLANNGKVDASSTVDMPTQVLLGRLPYLVRPDAKSTLVVGLASGVTAGSVAREPGLERIDVLEIEPAVIEASHFFDGVNGRPLDDPRVTAIGNDARNHLVLVDTPYDVIINEPSNPWITGVSNLFTREYLELGKSRLTEGGVFVQWAQIYGMGKDDLKSLLATFADAFPHVLLFTTVTDADLIMLGSEQPITPDLDVVASRLRIPAIGEDLARIGVYEPHDVLPLLLLDRDSVLEAAGDAPMNTDDNVRIEFSAPLHIHYSTQARNSEMLLAVGKGAWPLYRDSFEDTGAAADFLTRLGEALERKEMWVRAAVAYRDALELRPERVDLTQRVGRIRGLLADAVRQEQAEQKREERERQARTGGR